MIALLALLAAGCSSADEPDARAAAEKYVSAAQNGQSCALVAPRAARDCTDPRLDGSVGEMQLWGDEAVAAVGDKRVYLHRFSEGWKVTGAGCSGEPAECEVGGP
ncbi:hypothetical protein [Lentzea sp. NBRC 105346]|uniref:hypothetical protein n=1 Tax=Lentzea sp. NBRC 105346 TaxID=3032205 RepID=UPI0025551AB0|nr:hypothetical protein [Lentzea sp. NBRC 105346]